MATKFRSKIPDVIKVSDSGTFETSCLLCAFYAPERSVFSVLHCVRPPEVDDCLVNGSFHFVSSSKKSKPVQLSLF